ncbi:MAG: hypothetical protein EOO44_14545 [Flavobacterium sp.]|nr:MAG: hypothetical protein EOO44_14545 [Flavobacterium sp.]
MRKIIGIIGRISSGKTHAANIINMKFGYPIASFGGYLKFYCESRGLPTDRKYLQDLGENLIIKNSKQFLDDVIAHFTSDASPIIVLEGIRHKEILTLIKSDFKTSILIFIDADQETRYNRYLSRDKDSDIDKTKINFLIRDNHPVEKEIESLKEKCDLIIDSTDNYEDLLKNFINIKIKPTLN